MPRHRHALALAAGIGVDARVSQAMGTVHAFTWTTEGGGHYHTTPLTLAASLWLVALDSLAGDARPLPIDWSAGCFERAWWDPDYRLFSHYDVRERALDWATHGRPGETRTPDQWIKSPLLFQLSYGPALILAPTGMTGLPSPQAGKLSP